MMENILYFDELASTNDEAKKMAKNGAPDCTVIVAESQTNGKGRLGRSWRSKKGDGLYFSIIFRHNIEAVKCTGLTLVMAVSVKNAINEYCATNCKIKWPNDILLNNKKICGILTEASISGKAAEYMVTGIGVNVNNTFFGEELADKATSLFLETGKIINRQDLLKQILDNITHNYELFKINGFTDFLDVYKKDCINIGQWVVTNKNGQEIYGEAIDITELGELVVQTCNREIIYINSGEICKYTDSKQERT